MKDPAMAAAQAEIIEVLKKHDLMGSVLLCGRERSGFFNELSPSWSCAKVTQGAEGLEIRVRCKREDFPSKEAQAESLRLTVGGLLGLMHVHPLIGEMLTGMLKLLSQKVDVTHLAFDQCVQQARGAFEE